MPPCTWHLHNTPSLHPLPRNGRCVNYATQALKSSGGFVWACKNYDGDVQRRVHAGYGIDSVVHTCLETKLHKGSFQ